MTHKTYLTMAATGNAGKTTTARYVVRPGSGGALLTLESHSCTGEEGQAIAGNALAAHLFAPPTAGTVIDIGVGDTMAALEALRLVSRQDSSLPKRLIIVVPLSADAKSVAGLRWLIGQMPETLRPAIRVLWNRIPADADESLRASDVYRAVRALERQHKFRLCGPVLHESPLLNPAHPLIREYGDLGAVVGIPDDEIRAAPLSAMPAFLAGRDAAQQTQANCREVYAAIAAD